jgi:exodeoxyribonuclease VII small subunit
VVDMADQDTREQSFGDALAELDQIVGRLEGGQLDLEDSMGQYERGVTLLKSLQKRLADAQQKVTMLIGELEEDAAEGGPIPDDASGDEGALC